MKNLEAKHRDWASALEVQCTTNRKLNSGRFLQLKTYSTVQYTVPTAVNKNVSFFTR